MITPAATNAALRAVPCPLCGGLIHPIASRCKHCRASIGDHAARQRSGAAGLRALPALIATPTSLGLPSSTAAVALPIASSPSVNLDGQASANAFDVAHANDRPWWKRWPMIVVAVATVVIVVAVIMMVLPQDQRRGRNVVAPPAPSNMDTNPMPETPPALPSAPSDPWSGNGRAVPAPIDPSAPAPIAPSATTPFDPSAPMPIDPATPGNPARNRFVSQLTTAVCKQITDCTNIDPAMSGVLCDAMVSLLNQASPWSTCSFNVGKAATCLERVQTLSCDAQLNTVDAVLLLNDLPACLEALRC